MNKNTKILVGVGLLAVVGYLVWDSNKDKKVNATGRQLLTTRGGTNKDSGNRYCSKNEIEQIAPDGGKTYVFCNGKQLMTITK